MHPWLYGLFWVEAGRSTRQVALLCAAIVARVVAQRDVATALDRESALQARVAQAELHLLRAQVEPHFLFNTLAHLRASMAADPPSAQTMLDCLIVFLRANSKLAATSNIALVDELSKTEAYLNIMQIRLGNRLRYSLNCDESLKHLQVPNGCVLVLVENAIKHGIERLDTRVKF